MTEERDPKRLTIVSTARSEQALDREYRLRDVIAYLRRVGLKGAADRMSSDRQIIDISHLPAARFAPNPEDER